MRTAAVVSCLGVLLACGGCGQGRSAEEELARRVQALESNVAALQKRIDDLTLKNQVASSLLFRLPLEGSFQTSEFWEKTYDSGQADCAKRCIKELHQASAACLPKPEVQKLQCLQDATNRATNCHKRAEACTSMIEGTVRWFNEAKGFGFLSREGGPDVFVHNSKIRAEGFRTLNEGDRVRFEVVDSPKGPRAANVVKIQ